MSAHAQAEAIGGRIVTKPGGVLIRDAGGKNGIIGIERGDAKRPAFPDRGLGDLPFLPPIGGEKPLVLQLEPGMLIAVAVE